MVTIRRVEDGDPYLMLDGGPDEGSRKAYMDTVRKVEAEAEAAGITLRWQFKNPHDPGWQDVGRFVVENGGETLKVIGTLLAGWLAGKYGRKIRLELGEDLKVEATSVEEIEKLLQLGQNHRDAVAKRDKKRKRSRK